MRVLLIIFCFLISFVGFSQDLVFEHISSNEGLSNNLVRDITQDEQGYLWFATSGGLNRYDGYFFDIYKTVIGDTLSLSDSRLSFIDTDKNGFIWVQSTLGDIHRVDPIKHQVINLSEEEIIPDDCEVRKLVISSNGDIWIVLNKGLLRIFYPSNSSDHFETYLFNNQSGLLDNNVNFVYVDGNETIWVGTETSLTRIQVDKKELKQTYKFVYEDRRDSYVSVKEVNNRVYFGAGNKRLMVYDYTSNTFYEENKVSQKLRGDIITIACNHNHEMLIGTAIGDVAFYDPFSNVFNYYQRSASSVLKDRDILEIFADSYGVFWLITDRRGIYKYDPLSGQFKYFDLNSESRSFLGEPDKQIILEDSNRDIWIGINGGGLFLYNRNGDSFKQFKHNPDNSVSLSSDIVLSLFEDRSKNLWIGTSYGGVNKVSLRREQLRKITPVEKPQTDFDNYIRSLTTDVLGNIWVGSKAGKIHVYKGEKKIGTIPDDLYASESFPATNVYCLFFDNEHNLWIGSKGNGIYIVKSLLAYINDLKNRNIEVVHLKSDPENINSLSSDNVYSIKQDMYGQYWIGTFSGGINLLTQPFTQPVFQHISATNGDDRGIVSDEVRDLYFDIDQNLWIATSEGVSILESKFLRAQNKQFINLFPSLKDTSSMAGKVVYQIKQAKNGDIYLAMLDGGINKLDAKDFKNRNFRWQHQDSEILSQNAYSLEQDNMGNIWMGTDNGLYRMNSADGIIEKYRFRNSFVPLTFSEGCSQKTLRNELVFGSNDGFLIFNPDSIQKDTTQFPIRFSFLEVNGEKTLIDRSNILYQSIEDKSVIKLSHLQNNITLYFSVLDYNKPDAIQYSYYLENYDNFWSSPSTSNMATYRKLPPGDYILEVKGTNSSGTWMNNPAELLIQISPPFWKSIVGYILIILIASLTITISTMILYRQFVLQNRIKIENAITEKRFEYYTNISHEFKTPLSLILNPVEEIISSHKSSDFARQKGLQIKKNAIHLKQLIEQILDFRKIREGKMNLKVAEVNLIEFFREIYLIFLPLSKKMSILFDYDYDQEEFIGVVDVQQLEKVVYNLLSNAFRFTPAGKHVRLIVKCGGSAQNYLEFRVEDEGPGIHENELDSIFERFNKSKTSSGIGLFFTKELVLLHKGEINVHNNKKGGASFWVKIPVSKNVYSDDEFDQTRNTQLAFDLKSIDDIETVIAQPSDEEKIHRHVVDYMETILIVEDNTEMRRYLCTKLSARYKILEAENGEIGLELARKKFPDLIISDVIMAKMNGYELTRTLKDDFLTSHIPVILLTAEASEEKKILGAESGADDYIVKPFNLGYLLTKIEKTIAQRKKLKERFEHEMADKQKTVNVQEENELEFMDKVQAIVLDNLSKPELNVEFLVEKAGVSRTLFFKRMKSVSGYAPNEYLRIVRMKEAARLLTTTDKTVSEISNAVGFSDANYFGKTFKKHFGETPSVFKSNKQNRSFV